MTRRFRRTFLLILPLLAAFPSAVRAAGATLDDGQNALSTEVEKWSKLWEGMQNGTTALDPADMQQQQAIDAAAKWAVYRLDWNQVSDPGQVSAVYRDFGEVLSTLRNGHEKTQKLAELYIKQVIAHAQEVAAKGKRPITRINAARILARIPEQGKAGPETPADVQGRLTGTNQGDLADACAAIIKDPTQNDGAKFWAFRTLSLLLALPQQSPPALPPEKEQAALGAVVGFLKDRNKPFPPGTPQDEIDGFRYLRREALAALAHGHYATLADKTRPALVLLKVAARDGVEPEPRLDERVEAALGVARVPPASDKDYQPDYAAHQLGLFVADFVAQFGQEKLDDPNGPESQPWRVDASRLIEALELMKAQSPKDAHVARVADLCTDLLKKVEKNLKDTSPFDLEQALQAEASPGQSLYKGDADATVKPANRKDADAPPKPDEKKDK